ncbi:conserved domain protein [Actinomyces sp. oral taxon 175 str. F0384]|nr:conserved domain protein [Actinomyces sp. oral taxon 175 str. F0384]
MPKVLMEPIAARLRSGCNPAADALWTTGASVSLWPPGPIEVSPMS